MSRGPNQRLLFGFALIIMIPMVFFGTAGQHTYTLIVTDEACLNTTNWNITLKAYLQQTPRIDIIASNNTTISAFTEPSQRSPETAYR